MGTYSVLQIVERMYDNYYQSVLWPAFAQVGVSIICFPASLCLNKRHFFLLDGFIVYIFAPYCASKINTGSRALLKYMCWSFSSKYLRKRILSKPILRLKIADNFMDVQFPSNLTVWMVCMNNSFFITCDF